MRWECSADLRLNKKISLPVLQGIKDQDQDNVPIQRNPLNIQNNGSKHQLINCPECPSPLNVIDDQDRDNLDTLLPTAESPDTKYQSPAPRVQTGYWRNKYCICVSNIHSKYIC